jgi:hypothetical protein
MGSASAFLIRWINFFTMVSRGPLLPPFASPFLHHLRVLEAVFALLRMPCLGSAIAVFACHFEPHGWSFCARVLALLPLTPPNYASRLPPGNPCILVYIVWFSGRRLHCTD